MGVGWATGSATIIPHLDHLEVAAWLTSWIYLFNPLIGVFVSPAHGAASDACQSQFGKRRPFIAVLSVVAMAAIGGLICGRRSVVWCFVFYTIFDCCMDQLLIPGRALVSDLCEEDESSQCDLHFTRTQLLGRMAALMVGCVRWPVLVDGAVSQFQAQFLWCLLVVMVCLAGVWFAGSADARTPTGGKLQQQEYEMEEERRLLAGEEHGSGVQLQLNPQGHEADTDAASSSAGAGLPLRQYRQLVVIFLVETTGWILINSHSFWWMKFMGEATAFGLKASYLGLGLQALVGVAVSGQATAMLCSRLGARSVWYVGAWIEVAALLATRWVNGSTPILAVALAAITGFQYAVHQSLVHVVVQQVVADPANRGYYISMAGNASDCVAQILVAGISGWIVQVGSGDVSFLFRCVAALGAAVLTCAHVCDMCWGSQVGD